MYVGKYSEINYTGLFRLFINNIGGLEFFSVLCMVNSEHLKIDEIIRP